MSIMKRIGRFVFKTAWRHRALVLLVLVFLLSGAAVISIAYVSTTKADFVEVSIGRLSVEVPKSWSFVEGEIHIGGGIAEYVLMTKNVSVLRLVVYDRVATSAYMANTSSANVSQLLNAEALQLSDWYRRNYNSSQVREIEPGTREVSNIEASFVTATVSGVGNSTIKLTLVAFMYQGLVEVSFASTLEHYVLDEPIFNHLLDSIRLR
jgi:hypothetical protein